MQQHTTQIYSASSANLLRSVWGRKTWLKELRVCVSSERNGHTHPTASNIGANPYSSSRPTTPWSTAFSVFWLRRLTGLDLYDWNTRTHPKNEPAKSRMLRFPLIFIWSGQCHCADMSKPHHLYTVIMHPRSSALIRLPGGYQPRGIEWIYITDQHIVQSQAHQSPSNHFQYDTQTCRITLVYAVGL